MIFGAQLAIIRDDDGALGVGLPLVLQAPRTILREVLAWRAMFRVEISSM
jgi:hypothetical protein